MIVLSTVSDRISSILFNPGSSTSLSSMIGATLCAAGFLAWKRWRRNRGISLRVLARAMFPAPTRYWKSHASDVGFTILNVLGGTALIGWAILSFNWVSSVTTSGLVGTFGVQSPTTLSDLWLGVTMTLLLFLAHEFAYWFDHYLSHRVPFLWEFHRVHHEAEVLTPLTVFRVHPVDSLVFYNMTVLALGLTQGICNFAFGKVAHEFTLVNCNVLMVLAIHSLIHLQHTHIWMAFTGVAGRLLMSPAHHQVHHSTNPAHFNKNLGGVLSVFDWLFGTLHVPSKTPEKLTFGVEQERPGAEPHSATAGILAPFMRSWPHAVAAAAWLRNRAATVAAHVTRSRAGAGVGNSPGAGAASAT